MTTIQFIQPLIILLIFGNKLWLSTLFINFCGA